MTTVLQFRTPVEAVPTRERGESAGAHVDAILSTSLARVPHIGNPGSGSDRSKAIRDVFRALGWGKYFRVTKGGWTLGASIEWAKGYVPVWPCDRQAALKQEAARVSHYPPPACGCATCKYRERQREAVKRRVHHVLNVAFANGRDREFGDRSDTMSDYFDADYTFYP